MILEQELIESLDNYRGSKTWKNQLYIDILNKCNIDFSYHTKATLGKHINVIDAFANSFDENPYKNLQGRYTKFSKKIKQILFGMGNDVPNYIDEPTMLVTIEKFLIFCEDKNLLPIKKVPVLVWAVSTQNLNFVKKVLLLLNSLMHRYVMNTLVYVNKNWDEPINAHFKIDVSSKKLNKKKKYLITKIKSGCTLDVFKLQPFDFIEKYNLVTPLILACKLKNIEIAAFLVENGANWMFKDIHQKTAYDYAVENNLLANNKSTTELANALYKYFIYKQVSFKEDKHLKFWNSLKISNKLKLLDICVKRTIKYYEHPQQLSEGEK